MPKSLIVYFSQGGTTARVAESIAAGLRAAEWDADLRNMVDGPPPAADGYDLIGIGSPVYMYRPPFNVVDYVNGLPDMSGLPSFVFLVHGTYRSDAGTTIRRALARKGAREVGYYHCHGADYFLGYLKRGVLFFARSPRGRGTGAGRDVRAGSCRSSCRRAVCRAGRGPAGGSDLSPGAVPNESLVDRAVAQPAVHRGCREMQWLRSVHGTLSHP